MRIIGFLGLIGAGKDTAAKVLIEEQGYTKISFASTLKDACSSIFGWDRHLLEGDTHESRKFRDEIDPYWANELGIKNFTPRFALQNIGTDVMRNHFHTDIWVASTKKTLMDETKKFVITDCRFENEIDVIKNLNGTLIRIKSGIDPEWFDLAKDKNIEKLEEMKIHASEYSWVSSLGKIDHTVENNSSIEDLHKSIRTIFSGS